jgi:hypothetical protein|tara:strand:+ start:17505 stop:17816 length:312 start_codon:yes stop_codon:yes gene_type:complete
MAKRRDLSLEEYVEETTTNIREDRAMAKTLLMDVMADMAASPTDRREMGPIAAKFVENLQRSNEQMVKLAAILQRQKTTNVGLTADDKEQLFDLLNEGQEDGG